MPYGDASARLYRVIVSRIRRTVLERRLMSAGDRVVVACSGGPDSVAMTHALSRLAGPLALDLMVASVDHGLRDGAAEDVALARALAERLALPFRAIRVSVPRSGSIQSAARNARYTALKKLAADENRMRIAVGHTRDDQAETVLERLLRGASVRGLSGIAPKRKDGVVRPLIDVTRKDVLSHLRHHDLDFVVDPSNADPRFKRSRIREKLIPNLLAEDPAIIDHLARLSDDARATRRLVHRAGRRLLRRARKDEGLSVAVLEKGEDAARRDALRRILTEALGEAPNRSHLVAVDDLVTGVLGASAEVRLSWERIAKIEKNHLVVVESVDTRHSRGRASG